MELTHLDVQASHRECPLCGSMQAFPLRKRERDKGWIEVFISCTICPYEMVVRKSTDALEKLYKQRSRLLAASEHQIRSYGASTSLTRDALMEVQFQISGQLAALKEQFGE